MILKDEKKHHGTVDEYSSEQQLNRLDVITLVLPMDFSQLFLVKYIVRHVMEAHKSGTPCFFTSIPTIKYYCT